MSKGAHQTKLIVLAAGKGSRMKSEKPKVLHEVCEKSMLEHILCSAREAGIEDIYLVIGHRADEIRNQIKDPVTFVEQNEQLGTAHAVKMVVEKLEKGAGDVIIVTGDTPLVTKETFENIMIQKKKTKAEGLVVTATVENPFGYGRILMEKETGKIRAIREEKDASNKEKKIKTINTGMFCFTMNELIDVIGKIGNNNKQKEYYLTDTVEIFYNEGKMMTKVEIADPEEITGVNDRVQLAEVERVMRARINKQHMQNGVTIIDPQNTYIGVDVEIAENTVIYPGVILSGNTSVGMDCKIHSGSEIINSVIGNETVIRQSFITDSVIRDNVTVGPFAHIRPNSLIEQEVKIGNFVEVKATVVGKRSKISHLSYVGDAVVGEEVNVGCGVVTVNYDGKNKHRTTINDGAFIGSGTNLIAPVTIGKNGMTAAGSTITEDVPENALAIARERQTIKQDRGAASKGLGVKSQGSTH